MALCINYLKELTSIDSANLIAQKLFNKGPSWREALKAIMEGDKTISLYTNEDVQAWRSTLKAYNDVLKLKASKETTKAKKDRDLVALDKW